MKKTLGTHTSTVRLTGRRKKSRLMDVLLGKPLPSEQDMQERIGAREGVPIFGLDALSSTAYGPEAALTVLIPLGLAGIAYILPISISIIALLAVVFFSYRQTIEAYPNGAGSYTVARENLGPRLGLLAGTALMIDYLLNVAVGISSGVGALVSAVPSLQKHILLLCLAILVLLTVVNLRGLRETGIVFMAPTYLFIACLLGSIALGIVKTILSGGVPKPVVAPPRMHAAAAGVSAWLLIKAFSSGCTAMTGVEAVSNGVQAFRKPVVRNAQRTLTIIIVILMLMLAGTAVLIRVYHIGATPPGQAGYESVLSQLVGAVAGKAIFYYISIASILMVLALSANTSFADFPRLCRAMAQNGYLPYGFTMRGRRLVYSYGVYSLAILSGLLLVAFGGITDRLIPLFAIGAFLAFTLSQAGMVAHWRKQKGHRAKQRMIVNAVGATATGITVVVVAVAKFSEGAWMTVALIGALIWLMSSIQRHYSRVGHEIACAERIDLARLREPMVVVPVENWNMVTQKALRFAMTLSDEIRAVHIDTGEESDEIQKHWDEWVAKPVQKIDRKPPELVVIKSPYRYVLTPILTYIFDLERDHKDRQIAVVISQLVQRHWYQFFLHNQRAEVLSAMLTNGGDQRIVVVNVPWYLKS